MRCLDITPLNSSWSDFIHSFFFDLAPLGHTIGKSPEGDITIAISDPAERDPDFWHLAHEAHHRKLLLERADDILAFESDHPDVFAQMALFQPSAIQPVMEIVDFTDQRHKAILRYLSSCQSVTSRKLVGRRMGLLLWDAGQTGHTPLIGAAILASPRFSQRLRDGSFGWEPDYPRTSRNFDEASRAVRLAGLARMMQLAVACALPPYNLLSGAWLAALAPFTAIGQEAFRRAVRNEPDPDLAAVVTTTGKGVSGAPFRGHRLVQLSNRSIEAAPGSEGDVYTRVKPGDGSATLRADFEGLASATTKQLACDLLGAEEGSSSETDPDRAMAFALKKLGIDRSIFAGNEMGIHIGMLGRETRQHLSAGTPRPANKRPRLSWETVVAVWTKKFLPVSTGAPETATQASLAEHNRARRKKHDDACAYPQSKVKLSHLLAEHSSRTADESATASGRSELTSGP